ncbi:MAG: T9SS type A sorting domain-containing protein [Chitinophagaceae bacterium]
MKSSSFRLLILLLPLLLGIRFSVLAQGSVSKTPVRKKATSGKQSVPGETIHCYYSENQLIVNKLMPDEFDKAVVYNMQGAAVLRYKINASSIRMDATGLTEGVYLLVLGSTASLREKSFKVVIRK